MFFPAVIYRGLKLPSLLVGKKLTNCRFDNFIFSHRTDTFIGQYVCKFSSTFGIIVKKNRLWGDQKAEYHDHQDLAINFILRYVIEPSIVPDLWRFHLIWTLLDWIRGLKGLKKYITMEIFGSTDIRLHSGNPVILY